jgi:hypothetical protein
MARFGESCRAPDTRPFRIVCVDTCLTALRERGIKPDLVIILESQHWNLDDFSGLSGLDIPAAFDLSALPISARLLGNRLFLFFTPWTRLRIFQRLEEAGLLPDSFIPLGSVGISAVAISMRLTKGVIITAGIDFSFNMDLSHAKSTPGHLARLRRQNRFRGLINTDAAFGQSVSRSVSKAGEQVLSNTMMRNYRDLFEKHFTGCNRLFDLQGSGLSLGIKTLSINEAFSLLTNAKDMVNKCCDGAKGTLSTANSLMLTTYKQEVNEQSAEKLRNFVLAEQDRLKLLRDMLTGVLPMDFSKLATLIDECDYLWAHFPDYAASSRRPYKAELESGGQAVVSFLNRVRAEIDPFLKLWYKAV